MKITITKQHLDRALRLSAKAVARDGTLPIVRNVLLSVGDGIASCVATNLDVGVRVQLSAKAERDGQVVCAPHLLGSFIAPLQDDDVVTIETQDRSVLIRAKRSQATLPMLDAADFPPLPSAESAETAVVVPVASFRDALSRVIPCVAKTEARPELGGVFIASDGEDIVLAATDGFRLAEVRCTRTEGGFTDSVIVPASAVAELLSVLTDVPDDGVRMMVGDGQMFVRCGDVTIVSRLIAATYPDYAQIIPSRGETVAVVSRGDMEKALRVAQTFAHRINSDMEMAVEKDTLTLSAASQESGTHTTTLSATVEGGSQTLRLNPRYVLDGVSRCGSDSVEIHITQPAAPVLIVPHDGATAYRYVVMPIRT